MWSSSRGFTLMEVLVAVALVGICLSILLSLIADHLYLTRRLTERTNKLLHAINKTEEASLGILGENFELEGEKRVWRGKTGSGLPWKVVGQISEEDSKVLLYEVSLVDISLQGVGIQRQGKSKRR